MKKVFLIFIMMFSWLLIGFVSSQDIQKQKPKIKVAFVGALSGPLSEFGNSELEAIQDAIKSNSDKVEVELVAFDDQCKPELASKVALEVVKSGVDFVIGHVCSGATLAALPIYSENRVFCITASATSPKINDTGAFNNFLRAIPNDFSQSNTIINFALQHDYKNIVVVYESGDYAKNIVSGLKQNNKGQCNIEYIPYDIRNKMLGNNVSESQIQNLISSAELIVYCGYYIDFTNIYVSFRNDYKYQRSFLGTDGVHDEQLLNNVISYEDVFTINTDDFDQYSDVRVIVNTYKEIHKKEPGPFYERTYMAMELMIQTIYENPGLILLSESDRIKKYNDILKNKEVETIFGIQQFDSNGELVENDFSVYKIINNAFVKM